MKRVRAILRAVWTVLRRRQESLIKVPASNLYYAAAGFAFMIDPGASVFLIGLALIVLVFPLSADPLGLVPASRLGVWPLTRGERRALRAITPWLNPVTWLAAGAVVWRRVAWSLSGLVAGVFGLAFFAPGRVAASGRGGLLRWMPRFPGSLGLLVRKNLRGLVTTLDFWCAFIPGAGAAAYRIAGLLPKDAALPMTWIVLLALSTCAQTLFGLDGRGGASRYRLLPLRGWAVLLAKDVAFVSVVVVLTAALSPRAGLAGALVALATVRHAAIVVNRPQARWRLQAGTSFGVAMTQMVLMVAAASAADTRGWILALCVPAWAVSLWWGGRVLDGARG